jgi:hypothetical protein
MVLFGMMNNLSVIYHEIFRGLRLETFELSWLQTIPQVNNRYIQKLDALGFSFKIADRIILPRVQHLTYVIIFPRRVPSISLGEKVLAEAVVN